MESLATKYRPKVLEEVLAQTATINILNNQLKNRNFSNCYLFCGPTGVGKTTIARILANDINQGQGSPIEIDGASNNGVDNVRSIIESAGERSLDSEYKVFIIDECHMITIQGWNAFLKCIEEPPKYTIFIFCTTNPEKIPATIQNRLMRFNLFKIEKKLITERLLYICRQEKVDVSSKEELEGIDYISTIANGGMRDAIVDLEKCLINNKILNIDNITKCLKIGSYDNFFDLTNNIIDNNEGNVLKLIQNFYDTEIDLGQFIDDYLSFIIDLNKYCLYKDINNTNIPVYYEDKIKYTTGIENNLKYFNWLAEKVLNIKNNIKYDTNAKTIIEVSFIAICNGR